MPDQGGPLGFGFIDDDPTPPPVLDQLQDARDDVRSALDDLMNARAILDTARADVEGGPIGSGEALVARNLLEDIRQDLAQLDRERQATLGFTRRLRSFLDEIR